MQLHHRFAYRTVSALLTGALVFGPSVAFAVVDSSTTAPTATPEATNTPTPPTITPQPEPKPKPKPPAPTPPKKDEPAKPSSKPKQDDPSAIETPLTPEEQKFRDELAKRQAALDALQAQLDELDAELEIATENYNEAEAKLAETRSRLEVTEKDLTNAQAAYEQQVKLLTERIRIMYRGGTLDTISLLLESNSVADFVKRISFLNMIGEKDASLAETLGNQRDSVQQALVDLKDAKLRAEQLEFQLKARRIEIQLRIQERQQMLANAQTDLLQLLGQQSSQRQTEQAALLRDILSGAAGVGITVSPGSPVETALAYHGIPYVWGGTTPAGFDCSGLMLYVFRQHGVELPRVSRWQFQTGLAVSPADLQPGDAVFFGSPIHHVGMYLGNDYFIHAPRTGDYVKVSRLSSRSDYAGARRYPWTIRTLPILNAAPQSSPNSLLPGN